MQIFAAGIWAHVISQLKFFEFLQLPLYFILLGSWLLVVVIIIIIIIIVIIIIVIINNGNRTELDNTMSCYQLIKTMTKFEKRTNHRLITERLNVVMNAEKTQQFTQQSAPQQHAQNDAYCPITSMTCTLSN